MILKPDIPNLMKEAKTLDNNTRKRLKHANKPTEFKFVLSDKDYRITEQANSEHNTIFNTSTNRSSARSHAHLLLSTSEVIQKVVKHWKNGKRRSNSGVINEIEAASEVASRLIALALVNKTEGTSYRELDKTHEALQAKVFTIEAEHTPKKDLQDSEQESSELELESTESELDTKPKPPQKIESGKLPLDSEWKNFTSAARTKSNNYICNSTKFSGSFTWKYNRW